MKTNKKMGSIEVFYPWGAETERGTRNDARVTAHDARVTAHEAQCRAIWRGDNGQVIEYRFDEKKRFVLARELDNGV